MAKVTRKEMVSRTANKYICGRVTTKVSEEYRGWKQKRHNRKNGGVGATEGSRW